MTLNQKRVNKNMEIQVNFMNQNKQIMKKVKCQVIKKNNKKIMINS